MNKKKIPYRRALLVCGMLFFSCDIMRDGIFEVSGWSPGEGFHDPVPSEVRLSFTLEPDRISVERSFSLTEEGKPLTGSFVWKKSGLYFIPSAPLQKNRDYLVSLETGAQDTKGLSLERRFEGPFTTRPQSARPLLLSSIPDDGGSIAGGRETISLTFSEPMERSSFSGSGAVFSPSVQGVWLLEDNDTTAVFTPSEPWINGRNYRLTLESSLLSGRGLALGKTKTIHFSAGADLEAPALAAAYALDTGGGRAAALTPGNEAAAENRFWERNYALELVFTEPVDAASAANALETEPSLGITIEPPPDDYSSDLVFRFKTEPAWGNSFTIKLNNTVKDRAGNTSAEKTVFRVRADGPHSKPPSLIGIRVPLDPAAAEDAQTAVYRPEDLLKYLVIESSVFPFDTGTPFWIELYFDSVSQMDAFSLMERFRFTATNNAVSFSPREIRFSGFKIPGAASGWEAFRRAEISGVLTNHPYAGVVTIETGAGLEDSSGNRSAETFKILLLK